MTYPARKVLIVEDDVIMAMFLEEVCKLAGVDHVGTAGNVEVALELAMKHQPECVILDYRLDGDRTGLDLIAALRKQQAEVFTVLITAWDINAIAGLIQRQRPDCILRKPVAMRTLLEVINSIPGRGSVPGAPAAAPGPASPR